MNQNQTANIATLPLTNIELFDIFNADINWSRTYCAFFKTIPSTISISGITIQRAREWYEKTYQNQIVKKITSERYDRERKGSFNEVVYILDNECIVCMNYRGPLIEILYSAQTRDVQQLVSGLRTFKQRKSEAYIHLVVSTMNGFSLTSLKAKKLKCSIESNYNDDLVALHDHIISTIRKKEQSGLTLFYGIPGTGKSTYIRHLISHVNKKVIFLPPKIAGSLDEPNFTQLLVENADAVMVIEDAEDLLISRESDNNSAISMLLNLTDGLLGASLGIHFICTFNTNLRNIDKALLRKGRLRSLYEFKPLSVSKSKKLLTELGITNCLQEKPMTLAEIYNTQERQFEYSKKSRHIGFKSKIV